MAFAAIVGCEKWQTQPFHAEEEKTTSCLIETYLKQLCSPRLVKESWQPIRWRTNLHFYIFNFKQYNYLCSYGILLLLQTRILGHFSSFVGPICTFLPSPFHELWTVAKTIKSLCSFWLFLNIGYNCQRIFLLWHNKDVYILSEA